MEKDNVPINIAINSISNLVNIRDRVKYFIHIGCPKKNCSGKLKKNAQKNEDDLVESWKFGKCATRLQCFFLQKNIFPILIYIVDMAN